MALHIEDKLAEMAKLATQGKLGCVYVGDTVLHLCPVSDESRSLLTVATEGDRPFGAFLSDDDAYYYMDLHNTAPALLAVVRAARLINAIHCKEEAGEATEATQDVLMDAENELRAALAALDTLEV